jgi:hypothetical protein
MTPSTLANMIIHQMMTVCYFIDKDSKNYSQYAKSTLSFVTNSHRSNRIYRSNKSKINKYYQHKNDNILFEAYKNSLTS